MAKPTLIEAVQEFLDAEIWLQRRRSEDAPSDPAVKRFERAEHALRKCIAASHGEGDEELLMAASVYLDAAERFEDRRNRGHSLDRIARSLERAQAELNLVLARRIRPEASERYPSSSLRIIVGVDDSEYSEWAVSTAARLCDATLGRMLLVHAIEPSAGVLPLPACDFSQAETDLHLAGQSLLDRMHKLVPDEVTCDTKLLEGDAATSILSTARRWAADLIVVGTRGRSPITELLLGSTAQKALRLATCPVLVVSSNPRRHSAWNVRPLSVGSDVLQI